MGAKKKSQGQRGAPSKYTEAIADKICAEVANGSNLNQICGNNGIPDRPTVYRWLREHDYFQNNYTRAREDRADVRVEKMDQVVQDMREGMIDHNQARVEIDAIKWQAGKENSKRYGDSLKLDGEINVKHGLADKLAAAEQRVKQQGD